MHDKLEAQFRELGRAQDLEFRNRQYCVRVGELEEQLAEMKPRQLRYELDIKKLTDQNRSYQERIEDLADEVAE